MADFSRPKSAILTILKALNLVLENVQSFQKFKIKNCSKSQNGSFCSFKMTRIDLTQNLSDRKILKFPHCVFPIRLARSICLAILIFVVILREIEGKMCAYLTKSGYKAFNL